MDPPLSIPGYRVLRKVGAGATAEVFAAEDLTAARTVAIKVLLDAAPSAEQVDRFRREREVLARLDHPHVLRVHSAGSVSGRPYVITELLPGRTLADRVKEGLDWRQATELALQAARGLGALHAAGLIHRDVKPRNLLLDEGERVKVADLGLVAAADLRTITREQALTGTPAYMAPEALRGEKLRDPSCDVYSLGATCFELLTGALPHPLPTFGELLGARLRDPSPDPGRVRPGIPPAVAAVCRRAMAGDPSARYPNAGAFAAALEQARDGGGARGTWLLPWAAVALGGLVAAAALAGRTPAPPRADPSVAASPDIPASPPGGSSPGGSFPGGSSPGEPTSATRDLEALTRRLALGEASARGDAARYVAEHPEARSGLVAARLPAALRGAPAVTFSRRLQEPTHFAWGLSLDPTRILWVELCSERCPQEHSSPGVVGILDAQGELRPIGRWPGQHVTAISREGRYLATRDSEQVARLYLRVGEACARLLQLQDARITAVERGPQGRVAVGLQDGRVLCVDEARAVLLWERQVHAGPVRGLGWREDGLFSGAQDPVDSVARSAIEDGAPRPWTSPLRIGALNWFMSDARELFAGLTMVQLVYGLTDEHARPFVGSSLTQQQIPTGKLWSPSGVPSRAATIYARRYLVVIGSRRDRTTLSSQRRAFDLETGREVAAGATEGLEVVSVTCTPRGALAIGGARGALGVVSVRELGLGDD
ncbi:MAG: protein kinase [Planctomycetota bacterium]